MKSELKVEGEQIEALLEMFMLYLTPLDKILMSLILGNPIKKIIYSNEGVMVEYKFTYEQINKEKVSFIKSIY